VITTPRTRNPSTDRGLVGIGVASLYARIGRRLEVDRDGVRIPKGDTSIPWDLIEDAFVRTGARPLPISRLVFVTPIGPVRSPVPGGSCTRSGKRRLRQLAETILYFRDQIRAGTAQWEPNETRAQHGLRRLQGVTWLVFALGVIAVAIYLAAKYAPTGV
jgi:hypothetical protein